MRRAKWSTLAATYVMNTWESWADGSVSGIVLHSVPPLVVFTAAEAVTDLRDKLTVVAFTEVRDIPVHEQPTKPEKAGRKLFDDYLAEARAAWVPGVNVTPAWVRQVTSCSRGLSSRLAAALVAEVSS
ncbi:hypothetical protein UO65_5865 [Actinokineospora spheciospongiae]|uniref:Uncharacterized protein n=1 Tax=Actinokineospora spheciospongiae TaxID=909613 RepID=W7IE68_9PSEU|nr:hypothetical protein UO65_5865 [Actinokineospora spheciospongiae]